MTFDRRITPARPDLAALALRDEVVADRYVPGVEMQCVEPVAPLRRAPSADAMLETELLFGERFVAFEVREGWAWGQAAADGYVGYVPEATLSAHVAAPTHVVAVLRSYAFSHPDLKSPPRCALSIASPVTAGAVEGKFVEVARAGWVYQPHLRPLEAAPPQDWVAEAERFVGAPYLWGGRSSLGVDCSGLVQTAMCAAGLPCPRDTDMQESALGAAFAASPQATRRGDLVFWKGHVGVMIDSARLLHANAHHMQTAIEPLAEAIARIGATATGAPTSFRRLNP